MITLGVFRDHLRKHGYEKLGSGLYSSVWAKPDSDRVIKVGGAYSLDEWPHYVLWAISRGYAGKQAPKIYSFKLYNPADACEVFYVAVMERLQKASRDKISAMSSGGNYFNNKLPDEWVAFVGNFKKEFDYGSYDIHENNWMQRGDELVLTDPLSTSSMAESLPKRYRMHRHSVSDPSVVWC